MLPLQPSLLDGWDERTDRQCGLLLYAGHRTGSQGRGGLWVIKIFLVSFPPIDIVMFVFRIQQAWKHLAVIDIGRSNSISADGTMVDIDADAVLVTVATDAVLFCPACI